MSILKSLFRKRDAFQILIEEGMEELQPLLDSVNRQIENEHAKISQDGIC